MEYIALFSPSDAISAVRFSFRLWTRDGWALPSIIRSLGVDTALWRTEVKSTFQLRPPCRVTLSGCIWRMLFLFFSAGLRFWHGDSREMYGLASRGMVRLPDWRKTLLRLQRSRCVVEGRCHQKLSERYNTWAKNEGKIVTFFFFSLSLFFSFLGAP